MSRDHSAVPEVSFVTCARLPDLDPDDRLALEPLSDLGVHVTPTVWDDASVDWEQFDLTIIRSTWDYTDRRDDFLRWARSVPRLLNLASVVEWNTDKRYLADLASAGVPVVPTQWFSPGEAFELPSAGRHVIKPSVGAGSMDAEQYDLADRVARARAQEHVERLVGRGQTVMVQPYLERIDDLGETGLIYMRGELSHGIGKGAMLKTDLKTDKQPIDGLFKEERITPRQPSAEELAVGSAALAAVPGGAANLLYARVDLVPDENGSPLLMELELTEPSLFMITAPESPSRFARAIAAWNE